MPRPNEREFLHRVLQDQAAPIHFCETLFRISQTLDDLVDRDRPVTDDAIYEAFWQAMIELPANPFYRANDLYLRPLMAGALQDWRDSVRLERAGDHHGQSLAFVLRDQLTSLVVQCTYLVGGSAWMQQVSEEVRRHFHEDTLQEYIDDLGAGRVSA
ncbi:hypothetical protein IB234_15335 [Pseudomonas sp. PDM16]|uniref:hypothetical protein n=1 Tax=Pseudomonas sp. PDM16 TaxID=2769292 RepID=UPI0017815306|nr:hypothetical protein [Pseudomonas sp. PDM16]MBD9415935.1 hypothetical protein [Pseudomonas sp. PDM16]